MSFFGNILSKKDEKKAPVRKAPKIQASKKEEMPAIMDASKSTGKSLKKADNGAYQLILHPLITEKATALAQFNKYIFVTPVTATKSEVIKTVANVYGVKPVKVNFIRGKVKYRRSGKTLGKTVRYKKAIVTLGANDKIEIYEGV